VWLPITSSSHFSNFKAVSSQELHVKVYNKLVMIDVVLMYWTVQMGGVWCSW